MINSQLNIQLALGNAWNKYMSALNRNAFKFPSHNSKVVDYHGLNHYFSIEAGLMKD